MKYGIKLAFVLQTIQAFTKFESAEKYLRSLKMSEPNSLFALAWQIAELHWTYPSLGVSKCISANRSDLDYVQLSDLSAYPKPDWLKCVATVLCLINRHRLEEYVKRWGPKTPDILLDAYNRQIVWGPKEVEEWWEGRKRNKNKGLVTSAIERKNAIPAIPQNQLPTRKCLTDDRYSPSGRALEDIFNGNNEPLKRLTYEFLATLRDL